VLCGGRGRWPKPTVLFWCGNFHSQPGEMALSQFHSQPRNSVSQGPIIPGIYFSGIIGFQGGQDERGYENIRGTYNTRAYCVI
jgi:hypothetical protein